jgi:LAO/AO transport system kinase
VAEHGERGLRALGGGRAAERLLGEEDPGADVPSLTAALEAAAERAQAPE